MDQFVFFKILYLLLWVHGALHLLNISLTEFQGRKGSKVT